jgi:hypothetical protein
LIRSPITQKGWSKPMTISRVAEATIVRVIKVSVKDIKSSLYRYLFFCSRDRMIR